MASTSSSSCLSVPALPSRRPFIGSPKSSSVRFRPAPAKAGGSDHGYGFGLVDESMVVLRRRIRELELAERNYEAPAEWAEWEKRCYVAYGASVCGFAGALQALLLKTRPGHAVGLAALLAMSVPASAVLVWLQVAEAVRSTGVLGG